MINVTKVKALPGYRLRLTFSDKTKGEASLEPMLRSFPPFKPLLAEAVFLKASVEDGAVVWPNGLDVATERLYALAHGLPSPDTHEQVLANELEMSLRELRQRSDQNQTELAGLLEVTQVAISKLESGGADSKIGTLRRYLTALGWDLELVAVKDGERVKLRGL